MLLFPSSSEANCILDDVHGEVVARGIDPGGVEAAGGQLAGTRAHSEVLPPNLSELRDVCRRPNHGLKHPV